MKTKIHSWIKAMRLLSMPYLVLPVLLGQAMAFAHGFFDLAYGIILLAFGMATQLFIVFANDYADAELDAYNTTYTIYSGGSRAIPSGAISKHAIGIATLILIGLLVVGSLITGYLIQRMELVFFLLIMIVLLWMYSYKPIALSYRGFGELLQVLGLGVVMVGFGYYGQTGSLVDFEWIWLPGIILLNYAVAGITALPDYHADKHGGKKTLPVLAGFDQAKRIILVALALSHGYVVTIGLVYLDGALVWIAYTPVLIGLLVGIGLYKSAVLSSKQLTLFGFVLIGTKGYALLFLSFLFILKGILGKV